MVETPVGRKQVRAAIERQEVKSLADLPDFVTVKEAAGKLKTNPKTVADWMARKYLRSIRIRGRRVTTAQWIQDFIDAEMKKHG